MVVSNEKIREQIEYYMGDVNLARDKFFREQIQTDKDGYISVSHFLNCMVARRGRVLGVGSVDRLLVVGGVALPACIAVRFVI